MILQAQGPYVWSTAFYSLPQINRESLSNMKTTPNLELLRPPEVPVQPALDCSHPVGRDFCDSSAPVCSPSLQPHTRVSLLRRAEERCHEAKGKAKGNKTSVSSDFSVVFSSTLFSCQVYHSRYVLGRFRSTSTLLSPALQASLGEGACSFSFGWDRGHQMEPWGSACTNPVSAAFTECRSRGGGAGCIFSYKRLSPKTPLLVKRDFSLPRFSSPQRADEDRGPAAGKVRPARHNSPAIERG